MFKIVFLALVSLNNPLGAEASETWVSLGEGALKGWSYRPTSIRAAGSRLRLIQWGAMGAGAAAPATPYSSSVDCIENTVIHTAPSVGLSAHIALALVERACAQTAAVSPVPPPAPTASPPVAVAPKATASVSSLQSASPSASQLAPTGEKAGGALIAAIGLLPVGTIKASDATGSSNNDTEMAYSLSLAFDFALDPLFHIGLGPKVIFNVKGEGAQDTATQLDLVLRLSLLFPINPKVKLGPYVNPGYSIVFTPEDDAGVIDISNPKGFNLDCGFVVLGEVTPKIFLLGGVGYQKGFQKSTWTAGRLSEEIDLTTNYFHLDLGIGTRF